MLCIISRYYGGTLATGSLDGACRPGDDGVDVKQSDDGQSATAATGSTGEHVVRLHATTCVSLSASAATVTQTHNLHSETNNCVYLSETVFTLD